MWQRKTQSGIALDAGTASVALCQLARSGQGVRIDRWSRIEDPLRERLDATHDGPPSPARTARIVSQVGFHGTAASVALKPPDVTFLDAAVPAAMSGAPREQWLTMLRFEAARQLQCEPASLEVDFWPLPPGNRSGNNVRIAAVRQDVLARLRAFVEALGLELRTVDVLPCALVRAAWQAGPLARSDARPAPDELWGVIDIGYSSSLLAVALGCRCVYSRPLTIGGDAFTLSLVDALDVDYRSAELLKRRYDPNAAAEARSSDPAADVTEAPLPELSPVIQSVLRARVRALAGEIERAFAYPMENYPEANPSLLIVCGGGARLPGLTAQLEELLGVDVVPLTLSEEWAPPNIDGDHPGLEGTTLAACLGLALGELE